MGTHFGVGAPPILEPILVGIGMCTGGYDLGFDPWPHFDKAPRPTTRAVRATCAPACACQADAEAAAAEAAGYPAEGTRGRLNKSNPSWVLSNSKSCWAVQIPNLYLGSPFWFADRDYAKSDWPTILNINEHPPEGVPHTLLPV